VEMNSSKRYLESCDQVMIQDDIEQRRKVFVFHSQSFYGLIIEIEVCDFDTIAGFVDGIR
jgi:hypothetical protein